MSIKGLRRKHRNALYGCSLHLLTAANGNGKWLLGAFPPMFSGPVALASSLTALFPLPLSSDSVLQTGVASKIQLSVNYESKKKIHTWCCLPTNTSGSTKNFVHNGWLVCIYLIYMHIYMRKNPLNETRSDSDLDFEWKSYAPTHSPSLAFPLRGVFRSPIFRSTLSLSVARFLCFPLSMFAVPGLWAEK